MKLLIFALAVCMSFNLQAEPPYFGTSFIVPDFIRDTDPTTFVDDSIAYQGTGQRYMFDRRTGQFATYTVHLFDVEYSDSADVEFQVNSEFTQIEAAEQASFYATAIGQIPAALKTMVETVWIHKGDHAFGGGNQNILIHTGILAEDYVLLDVLAEILVHEATHTSIDPVHENNPAWIAAQTSDGEYISEYARDYPDSEDLAESLLVYLAVKYRSDRISAVDKAIIESTIPNRIAYFDALNLDFSLLEYTENIFKDGFEVVD